MTQKTTTKIGEEERMKYLEYTENCPECKGDMPVIVQGHRKNPVTFCYRCEIWFTLRGRIIKGSKKEISTQVKALCDKEKISDPKTANSGKVGGER